MCFSTANRGIPKPRPTDAFGLTYRVRSANGRPSLLASAELAALLNRSSASTSSPRVSTAKSPSQLTQHRLLHSAPKQKSGLPHSPRDGASRSNPPLSLGG